LILLGLILLAAACWGFAEATLFFIVPDVLLMFVGLTSFKKAFWCSLAALLGALVGGGVMFHLTLNDAERARALLDQVPGIQPPLIESVRDEVRRRGLSAVVMGPAKGTPYKIYAVEEAARGETMWGFLLVSTYARYIRFFLSAGLGALLGRVLSKFTDIGRQRALLAGFWTLFYGFYFWRFGW
jgi:hypothetical protein